MGKSVNKVILLGHVGKAPDIRSTNSGIVANLSIATQERQKDDNGEWQDKPEWHNLVAFKRTAEIIRDYVTKGSKIYVEGKLQTSKWHDNKADVDRYKTEIVVFEIVLLSAKDEGSSGQGNQSYAKADQGSQRQAEVEIDDSDIPF